MLFYKGSFQGSIEVPFRDPLRVPLRDPLRVPLRDPLRVPLRDPSQGSFKGFIPQYCIIMLYHAICFARL